MTAENETEAHGAPHARGFIRPRDTRRAIAQSGGYSRVVGLLRWALAGLVLVLLAAVLIWPMVQTNKLHTIITESVPNLVVENLHLTGLDDSDQPYSLTAERALQAGKTKNFIDLEKPQGEITLNNGAWVAGKAQYGRFDQPGKRLWLGGNVQIFHDQGYQFTTSEAQLDMSHDAAWGDQPVLIQGSFGEIRGQGFRLLKRGTVMIVKGHAQALLNLEAEASSSPKPPVDKPPVNHSTSR
jgi:lipopolysaccharide export system protein LptC